MTDASITQSNVLGASFVALWGMVLSLTGDDNDITIQDFLRVLERVPGLGGCTEAQNTAIARFQIVGAAYDFAWYEKAVAHEKNLHRVQSLSKELWLEGRLCKSPEVFTAIQKGGKDVQSFASRPRVLGNAAIVT